VVVASGNHWWLDALFGAIIAAAAAGLAALLARVNPDWAFMGGDGDEDREGGDEGGSSRGPVDRTVVAA
jgi:hypothetical protein